MAAKQGKILRIVIHALGSPSWGCMDPAGVSIDYLIRSHRLQSLEILRLLHALRGLMRASLAVCMISMPTFLFDDVFVTKIRHIGDTVVRLESFADIGKNLREPFLILQNPSKFLLFSKTLMACSTY